jgi:hypothetical protein
MFAGQSSGTKRDKRDKIVDKLLILLDVDFSILSRSCPAAYFLAGQNSGTSTPKIEILSR